MARASSLERAKTHMKKVNVAKGKKKREDLKIRGELGEEAYQEKINLRSERTLREKVAVSIWDLEHKQYPFCKINFLKNLLKERLLEINIPKTNLEVIEKNKIEGVLNEFAKK